MKWVLVAALLAAPASAQIDPATIGLINIAPTGTPLQLGDDRAVAVQLGFSFDYFGQTFTQAWVSSNGFVSFQNYGHLCCDGWPIENAPRNAVYGLWSDLISGGNPYTQTVTIDGQKIFVAGWYQTQEYGSWLPNTFELQLYEGGQINFVYGDINNQYHTVLAGLTGATSTDNYLLLYGQNVTSLANTSWSYGALPSVDCNVTPFDPSCPPITVAFSPVAAPIETPGAAVEQVQEEAVAEAVAEPAVEAVVEPIAEAVAVVEAAAEVASIEQVAEVRVEAEAKSEKQEVKAERLSPTQLAALTSGRGILAALLPSQVVGDAQAQESAQQGPQEAQQGESKQADTQQAAQESDVQATTAQQDASMTQETQQVANASEAGFTGGDYQFTAITPQQGQQLMSEQRQVLLSDMSNPALQLQILEMMNAGQSESSPAEPSEEIQQLSGGANLVQYAQARIPDVQFYNQREIYRQNRPVDAYLVMYRLMMNNDQRWLEMIGQQYER